MIADGDGKNLGSFDHSSPGGCHVEKSGERKGFTTQTTPNDRNFGEIWDISKRYKIKPGHKVEPVIFEPQKKTRLSRSTYKVNSYKDFKPYKETIWVLHDHVGNLYKINRPKGTVVVQLGQSEKNHFGMFACKQATYKCRIQNQYTQLRK